MSTYVLVHGAFRGGWAWGAVERLLVAAGDEVHAPSLTGMGDRVHLRPTGAPYVQLSTWVEDLVSLFHTYDLNDVVLVGHSQGGLVIQSYLAEELTSGRGRTLAPLRQCWWKHCC